MALTLAQIESLWDSQGGNPAAAPTIAAIAEAESGGNPGALNNDPATGDYSVGLFQTNYFGSLLAGRTAEYGSPAALQSNVDLQVKSAIGISGNGTNFSPWSTFKSGAYEQYLPAANAAAGLAASTPPPTGSGGGTSSSSATLDSLNLNPLDGFGIPGSIAGAVSQEGGTAIASGVGAVVGAVAKPLKAFIVNSGLILFGLVFLLVGLVVIAHTSGHDEVLPSLQPGASPGGAPSREGAGAGAGEELAEAAA